MNKLDSAQYSVSPVAVVESCFEQKFGIPRQSGLVPEARAILHMLSPFDDPQALAGLEQCSHLWLQFIFHQNKHNQWRARVRPPRLGGNKSLGVFATRSPYRPNGLGLSVVKLERIETNPSRLLVSGVDLLDGTPVLDIKPYVPYCDAIPEAVNTIAAQRPAVIEVRFSTTCEHQLGQFAEAGAHLRELIKQTLQLDPRPSYQALDAARVYGTVLEGIEVKWRYLQEDEQTLIEVCSALKPD